jgi:uncharacterized protein
VAGVVIPDPRRRFPGRGAWVHPVPECLHRAVRRSAFPRALRVPGPLDVDPVRSYLLSGAAHSTERDTSTNCTTGTTGARELLGPDNQESQVDPS